ncbi:MAG: phage tail protein [Desulfobulbaceae bacterium]|nr:phage tail protein [Desulfobulbaceae bacterium]
MSKIIEIDDGDLDRVVSQFAATQKQIEVARVRALRKTGRQVGKLILAKVAKKERMPRRALHNRVFVHPVKPGDDEAAIFIGTMPIDATMIGNPAQAARGVRVGRHSYPGAFVQSIYTNTPKVWIRLGSKHYDPARYPTRSRKGDRGGLSDPALMGRFPVVKAAVPIDGVVEDVAENLAADVPPMFLKNFEHELNYEVNVK